jgi:hypothetical protein
MPLLSAGELRVATGEVKSTLSLTRELPSLASKDP